MEVLKTPRILYLKGVFVADCKSLNDVVDEKFMNEFDLTADDMKVNVGSQGAGLPRFYEGCAKWPSKMTAACATCSIKADVAPKTILKMIEKDKSGAPRCPHNSLQFHSWPCAAYHIKYFMGNDQRYKLNLAYLYEELEGKKHVGEIEAAQPIWLMTQYGGPYLPADWDKMNDVADTRSQDTLRKSQEGNLYETPQIPNLAPAPIGLVDEPDEPDDDVPDDEFL